LIFILFGDTVSIYKVACDLQVGHGKLEQINLIIRNTSFVLFNKKSSDIFSAKV
jgi:hypothetical protein